VVLAALLVPRAERFGDFIRVRISRTEAEAAASLDLRSRAVEPGAWRRVTLFQPRLSTVEFEYLRRAQGRGANGAVAAHTDTGLWLVRFFQPLRKEEWRVYVDQQGKVIRTDHLLDEKAPGARLSPEEARRVAEAYLLQEKGISADRYRLVDSSIDKKDQRTDHTFVWEDSSFRVAEARARVSVAVLGNEVSSFRRFLKLPEEWLREFQKPRLTGLVLPAALGAAGLLLLVLFILRLGGRDTMGPPTYRWRGYITLGAAGAVARLLLAINQWPVSLAGYDTTTPLTSYLSGFVLSRLAEAVALGFLLFLAALAADVFLQSAGGDCLPQSRTVWRPLAVFLVLWGAFRLEAVIDQNIPGPRLSLPLWQLPGADSLAPAVAVLGQAFFSAAIALCVLAVVVSAALRHLNPLGRRALLVLAAAVVAAGRNPLSLVQFAWYLAAALAAAGALVAVLRICGPDLATYALAFFWLFVAGPATALIEQPAPWLLWNGIAAAGIAIAAGLVFARRRER
jgi:hypothetical protein